MIIPTLTPAQIAEGRKEAKREFDAKMAYYAAVETLNSIQVGAAADPTMPATPSFLSSSYQDFSIKHGILLTMWQAKRPIMPAQIARRLTEVGIVAEGYPPSNVSPKLALYREEKLVEQTPAGWIIADKGREVLQASLKAKGIEP